MTALPEVLTIDRARWWSGGGFGWNDNGRGWCVAGHLAVQLGAQVYGAGPGPFTVLLASGVTMRMISNIMRASDHRDETECIRLLGDVGVRLEFVGQQQTGSNHAAVFLTRQITDA